MKKPKRNDVMISAVGIEDEYGGMIIEVVTNSEENYVLLQ